MNGPYGLREQLKAEEDSVPYAYPDSKGYLTIGVGRLIDKRKGGRLRPNEIDFLLDNDIAEKTEQVLKALPWAAQLNEARRAVLVGMAFQMGLEGLLGFVNTLKMVQAGDYEGAARGMLASKWAREDSPARAARLAEQMRTGVFQRKPGF